jgi:hypothetical protein
MRVSARPPLLSSAPTALRQYGGWPVNFTPIGPFSTAYGDQGLGNMSFIQLCKDFRLVQVKSRTCRRAVRDTRHGLLITY